MNNLTEYESAGPPTPHTRDPSMVIEKLNSSQVSLSGDDDFNINDYIILSPTHGNIDITSIHEFNTPSPPSNIIELTNTQEPDIHLDPAEWIDWEVRRIEEMKNLETRNGNLTHEIQSLNCEKDKIVNENGKLKQENVSSSVQFNDLQNIYESVKSSFEKNEKVEKSLFEENQKLKNKLSILMCENEDLKLNINGLVSEIKKEQNKNMLLFLESNESQKKFEEVLCEKKAISMDYEILKIEREQFGSIEQDLVKERKLVKETKDKLKIIEDKVDKDKERMCSLYRRILQLTEFRNETLRFTEAVKHTLDGFQVEISSDEKNDTMIKRMAGKFLREEEERKIKKQRKK
jgi:hypothetical protein